MIAARPIQDLTRRVGRNTFDLPVAALAGLAVAFVAFAMPADLLGRLVTATGLPHLIAAADPPLGLKARALIGMVGAGAAFGLVFLLLRLLDRGGRPEVEPELTDLGPRLRRRDLHPDAPACRPISATRDFGEPAPPAPAPAEPQASAWLAEAEPPVVLDQEPVPFAEHEEPLELNVRTAPSWLAEPEPEVEPALEAADPEPAFAPESESEPAPEAADSEPAFAPESERTPLPAAEASLDDLMRRLEQGLARRRTRRVFTPQPQPHAPAPQVFPEADDDRLQIAIESLQRFAARGD